MSDVYLEDGFEKIFIKAIEDLGYEYVSHQDIVRDSMKSPIASEILRESLRRINCELEDAAIDEAIHVIKNIDAGLLVDRNEIFFEYLQNGIEIVHLE
ncbi:MAG: type I restriction endonuclease, partial [Finegoldia magna]